MDNDVEEDIIRPTKTGPVQSAPGTGTVDPTKARYSPAFMQQQQHHDVMQVKQPTADEQVRQEGYQGPQKRKPVQLNRTEKSHDFPVTVKTPEVSEEVVSRSHAQLKSSQQDQLDGRNYHYQNGFGNGYHNNEDEDWRLEHGVIETRRMGEQRTPTSDEVRGRSSHEERADTSQSGRLSQAAMMVRDTYEKGEFDQEVAITRGSHICFALLAVFLKSALLYIPGVEKMVLSFCFFLVKKTKNLERSNYLFLMVFRILFFSFKFCAQTMQLLFLYYNFIFSLHEFTYTPFSTCRLILLQ